MIFYEPKFGLGNIIQTTPAIRYLQGIGQVIIIATPKTRYHLNAVFGPDIVFENVAVTRKDQYFTNCTPQMFAKHGDTSEVLMNLMMVKHTVNTELQRKGFCSFEESDEVFDIVIANGYNKTKNLTDWVAKTYPHFPEVVAALPQLKIASVGLESEYIPGTINRTGIGLQKTFGLLKNARLVVANDTGLYHAAAALGTPTLVLFTMTDTHKNHDPVFHQSARIITVGLPCQSCQLTAHHAWIKNKPQCQWACRNINPTTIVNRIAAELAL